MQLGSTIWWRNDGPGDLQMCRVARFLAYLHVGGFCALRDFDFKRPRNLQLTSLRAYHCIPFFVGVRSHHLFSRTVSRRCVARRVKGSSIDPHTDLFIVSFGARRINFYIACKARRAWTAPCRICVLGKGAQRKSFVGSVGPLWFVVSNDISSDASKIRFFVPRRRHNPLEFSVSR